MAKLHPNIYNVRIQLFIRHIYLLGLIKPKPIKAVIPPTLSQELAALLRDGVEAPHWYKVLDHGRRRIARCAMTNTTIQGSPFSIV